MVLAAQEPLYQMDPHRVTATDCINASKITAMLHAILCAPTSAIKNTLLMLPAKLCRIVTIHT